MNIETTLAEIRASAATVSALHAQGTLTRADLIAAINLIETCCDDIARLTTAQPATGTVKLPIKRLCDVAAEMRAHDAATHARATLVLVPASGDAA